MKKRGESASKIILIIAAVFVGIVLLFSALFASFVALLSSQDADAVSTTGANVALINVQGPILTSGSSSPFGSPIASSKQIVELINVAQEDDDIKAIVLNINSPGGSAVASDDIGQALMSAQVPTVAYIHEVGASGGYWIASAADHIVAHRMAITGSIGVVSSYLEFSGLFDEYGIGYERLVAGEYKDIGTPFKELTAQERALLQAKLDKIHDEFITHVASQRDLPESYVRSLATGEIYLGLEAKEKRLIDETGSLEEVKTYLTTLGIENPSFVEYKREPTLIDVLTGVSQEFPYHVGRGIGAQLTFDQPVPLLE